MSGIYIALGANLSNQKTSFIKALEAITAAGAQVLKVSGLWQSPSWPPGLGHPDYLNAVAEIKFGGTAQDLLAILQSTETSLGRERSVRNAPRPLDLDILDFRGKALETEALTLPHPRMFTRGFVLFPLAQIAPEWTAPKTANHIDHYLSRLPLADVEPMIYRGKFWR